MEPRTPEEHLDELVRRLDEPAEPDADLCGRIGAGDLENLLRAHEEDLWPRIVELATENVRFRRALSGVWAYSSPAYPKRNELLESLGEFWTERVERIAYRHDFGDDAELHWRAFRRDGRVTDRELIPLLRSATDSFELKANHVPAPRARLTEAGMTGPWSTALDASVRSWVEPWQAATWMVREHGRWAVGLVRLDSEPDRLWVVPCARADDRREWVRGQIRRRPGWHPMPESESGVYVEELPAVERDVELVQVHVAGQGSADLDPFAGRVLLVHWDVPEDFVPPEHEIVSYRRTGAWSPAP